MKRGILIAGGAIVVLAIALAAIFVSHRGSATTTGRNLPPGAQATVRLLLSARGRRALTPELNELLRAGRLFPAGTTFAARPGSWHQAGAYANVSGMLRLPGKSPVQAEIGLVYRASRWLVTFEANQ